MSADDKGPVETDWHTDLSELWNATKPLLRRLPGVKKAIERLTGGLPGAGAKALVSRLELYRTGNLVKEAQQVADATGLPMPVVFNKLVRQRRIDELTIDAVRRVGDGIDAQDEDTADSQEASSTSTTDRWFHALYEEAGTVDEADVREAFVRILAGELQTPGSFSLRTLRLVGGLSQTTSEHFRRAASVSIRLTPDGTHPWDARIPAIGGDLAQNCLLRDGLSYDVLTELTENGLIHHDYSSYHPYRSFELRYDARRPITQVLFAHQGAMWRLSPKADTREAKPLKVTGAKLTSCGIELLSIVDMEPLPKFTTKLMDHFSKLGYQMAQSH